MVMTAKTVQVKYKPDPGDPEGQVLVHNFSCPFTAELFLDKIRKNPDVASANYA